MTIRTYSELSALPTFKERFEYLKLGGTVGQETFGFDRIFNQKFYRSSEWKQIRNYVIARDNGCDLGVKGHEIPNGQTIYIHHINPITIDDILERRPCVFDLENLISASFKTHNAIHYGTADLIPRGPAKRTKNDTCPWR